MSIELPQAIGSRINVVALPHLRRYVERKGFWPEVINGSEIIYRRDYHDDTLLVDLEPECLASDIRFVEVLDAASTAVRPQCM